MVWFNAVRLEGPGQSGLVALRHPHTPRNETGTPRNETRGGAQPLVERHLARCASARNEVQRAGPRGRNERNESIPPVILVGPL